MGNEFPASRGASSANLPPLETGTEARNFGDRIARYGKAKARSTEMADYLSGVIVPSISVHRRDWAEGIWNAVKDCGSYLLFRDYHELGEIKLAGASFCRRHLICPFCAIRRGTKLIETYDERLRYLLETHPDPHLQLVTLTVKNGDDLLERFDHLTKAFRTLTAKRKKGIQRSSGGGEFANIKAGAYSIEFTNRGNGWHPHIHLVTLNFPGQEVNQEKLSAEWLNTTGDSHIVDVRDIDDPINGFMEVFKYALKFSDLDLDQNWHAFELLFGRRLIGAFGSFYGLKTPENLEDELIDNSPFTEMFFKYVGHSMYKQFPRK